MRKTIADRYPEGTAALAKAGFVNIAALAQCYEKYSEMDAALGFTNAAHHWFNGRNNPGGGAEKAAGLLLKSMNGSAPKVERQDAPEPTDGLLMVVCPPSKSAKVQRVLEMMGCEVEAV